MRRVAGFLREQGINVWVDNEKLVPGTPIWEVEIENAISNAGAIIVLLSPNSKNSPWVRREISYAEDNEIRIVPILISGNERTAVPIRLTNHQRIDIRQNEEGGLNALSPILSLYLGEQEKSQTPTPTAVSECTDSIGCVAIAPSDPIHIAYMLSISGKSAFLGKDFKGAIDIAIYDRGGQLLGHKIKLTGEDTGCSAEGGLKAAIKIVADPTIIGVIGTNCASAATAALPTISRAGLVMLSPTNTAPALTLEGETWQPGYYRLCHTDLLQGSIAAEFSVNELKVTKAATIHDGSPYANTLQAVFANRFQELGGTVTFQGAFDAGDMNDIRAVLNDIAIDTPEILYLPIFEPEGPFIVTQSSKIAGLENTILMGADGLLSSGFPGNAGSNVVGMYLTGSYVSGPAYDEFLAKWQNKFGGLPPSGFHAFAYDATNLLLDAIKMAAVFDRDGTIYIGRQALRDTLNTITDYAGITGNLSSVDRDYSALGIPNPSHGDLSSGEALGIFQITRAELDGNWPPPVVYTRKNRPFVF